jgi:hypothetical protein
MDKNEHKMSFPDKKSRMLITKNLALESCIYPLGRRRKK